MCFTEHLLLYLLSRNPGEGEIAWLTKRALRRRRMGAHGMMFRRRRVFVRLREGFTYEEIAAEEGVSPSRVRQIVSGSSSSGGSTAGRTRQAATGAARAAIQLAGEDIAASDVSAIMPYLRALDRLDRYQTVAAPTRSLTTRRARSCSTRSTGWPILASARTSPRRWAHLKATGQIRGNEPADTEGQGAGLAGRLNSWARRPRPRGLRRRIIRAADFFTPTGRNPLKGPIRGNKR